MSIVEKKLDILCHLFFYELFTLCSVNDHERVFMSRKSCKICENTIKSKNIYALLLSSKAIQWAGLGSVPGPFWPTGLLFDTPALKRPLWSMSYIFMLFHFQS